MRGSPAGASFSAAAYLADVFKLKLADLHEGLVEADIKEWLVAEGDEVGEFEDLCFVMTDKASTEISSPVDGKVLKIYHPEGSTAKVGEVLVDIETDGPVAGSEAEAAPAAEPESAPEPAAAAAPAGGAGGEYDEQMITNAAGKSRRVPATPAVRGLARKHKIDLSQVAGNGKDGRVLKGDILKFIESGGAEGGLAPAAPQAPAGGAARAPAAVVPGESRTEKVAPVTKAMIRVMEEANAIPHFGYSDEITLNSLIETRLRLKPVAEAQGIKLTMMPLFIKAASMALTEYPILNSSLSGDKSEITYHGSHNICVAMDTPDGLTVPSIKSVEQLSILDIAAELNRLQELGAAGRLSRGDLEGGTFSLSNVGNIGGTYLSPVIIPGQVAIGAIGALRTLPRFDAEGNVIPAKVINVSWSGDHRIIDGATMARFSNVWKNYLENPDTMILNLK
ncbi:dihydrolipoamide branched chain transacylase E2 [Thecamonas trahens ATCC 50062]|uniref:Dihydrolipoamide acetyltransferase component of pyruvate dehydrogenase complex n=1 Tax=Thecamonas trahens ATCC 50062 TaxID=461836 RepID=A0A0L0DDY0_THETB|nr:dihydrolipoamide branched chain transacylase E2 [Thecamonas trahens ATCC 50062]KNC50504.1 dihydrolipoamide branched chain transacylase E2 [Thecamonas trahens ATCC 50062]|eukprot:XP_013762397.1 dihydrolipoamide branched chain transacylase E2 [Thecamonas trahens ATCC 50062]